MMHRRLTKIARFESVRRVYSSFEHCKQKLFGSSKQFANSETSVLITDNSIGDVVDQLRLNGIAVGIRLRQTTIDALRKYATAHACFVPPNTERKLSLDEIVDGTTPVLRAQVCDPLGCGAIQRLLSDSYLTGVARQYLGYVPNHVKPSLVWSIASPSTAGVIRQPTYDASKYHYDTEGYNSLQALFFLTDVCRDSGAHAVIQQSHRRKPLRMKLQSSIRIGEQKLLDYYGEQAETVVVGKCGMGFVEDPACFHRVIHPTQSNRLALRLVYS
jgi:hypothetical protein